MPIANGFLLPDQYNQEYFFEMAVASCPKCAMFQLINQPAPEQMFHDHYAFFSGTSVKMGQHFKDVAEMLQEKYLKDLANPFVVEIGSNDGIMLKHIAQAGIRHLGVEPSSNVAEVARNQGVNTICRFFDEKCAKDIVREYGKADVYFAANVMCHIPTLRSVIAGIAELLSSKGVAVFEDPYLGDVIEKTSYDQIYDEHVFLFSLHSIQFAFAQAGMELFHVERQGTHGGSMRYFLAHNGAYQVSDKVRQLISYEKKLNINSPETYEVFRRNCERSRDQLKQLLEECKQHGKRVVGYAATSKSTTVLNYCNIGPDLIDFISDTTPIKQGKFSPGTHIPIRPYEDFKRSYPDCAVLFAWNHQEEIFAKENSYSASGGRWITFVPTVSITPPNETIVNLVERPLNINKAESREC